jgi:pre-mRNA-processing factor 17
LDGPADFKPQYGKCYIPEKNTHSWFTTQKAGFQVIRFFPKSGHFIMSGNAEGKVLLFDLIKDRSLAHTYVGHSKALRDIQFTNDGKHFLSCGFDGIVHYWDTEYGRVLRTFKLKKLPFTVKFHP